MSPKPLLLALLISLPAHAYDLNEAWAAARVHSAQYDAARHARNAAQEPALRGCIRPAHVSLRYELLPTVNPSESPPAAASLGQRQL